MTPPVSASPAKSAKTNVGIPAESLESKATRAKLELVAAAYAASPLRLVEKHPIASVTATAAATMTLTVLASSRLLSPATTGLFSRGLAMAGTFAKSDVASHFVQSFIAKMTGGEAPPSPAAEAADVTAVG